MRSDLKDNYTGLSEDLETLFDEVSCISGFNEQEHKVTPKPYEEELERQSQKLSLLNQR